MEFSRLALMITLLFWSVESFISYQERTFWRSQGRVQMTFLRNWAISIGMPIFATVNYLVVPHLRPLIAWYIDIPIWMIISYFIVKQLYWSWWKKDENIGHVYPDWSGSEGEGSSEYWRRDISIAGWTHFFYMVVQIAILGLFLFSPVEGVVVAAVGILLLIFIVIINLQAKYIQKSVSISWIFAQLITLILMTAIKGALAPG